MHEEELDRLLEGAMQRAFANEAEDEFAVSVMNRIHRRSWLRRILLGAAFAFGAAFAVAPLTELVTSVGLIIGEVASANPLQLAPALLVLLAVCTPWMVTLIED